MSSDLHKLAQAMCSIDLAESHWTQVSFRARAAGKSPLERRKKKLTRKNNPSKPKPQELPRLPIPDLALTASRYLGSLKAVLAPGETREERVLGRGLDEAQWAARWDEFERADKLVKLFLLNEGPQLQRDLKEYANKCQNWVSSAQLTVATCEPFAVNCVRRVYTKVVVGGLFSALGGRLIRAGMGAFIKRARCAIGRRPAPAAAHCCCSCCGGHC